jgi:tRNA(fMet)-specific endonuclease VapC
MQLFYLLDTNIVSYFVRGGYPEIGKHLDRAPLDKIAVSAVTEAELWFWILQRPPNARIRVGVEDFLMRVRSLPWDSGAAQSCARTREILKRQGRVLSTEDLMIAAHALSLGLTMVTNDSAFSFVDGLKTEDWTVA